MKKATWGNFITCKTTHPFRSSIAAGNSLTSSTSSTNSNNQNAVLNWPVYTNANLYQIILNGTGGEEFTTTGVSLEGTPINVTDYKGPRLTNYFPLVNAWTWEGGWVDRCDFWRGIGSIVPE